MLDGKASLVLCYYLWNDLVLCNIVLLMLCYIKLINDCNKSVPMMDEDLLRELRETKLGDVTSLFTIKK